MNIKLTKTKYIPFTITFSLVMFIVMLRVFEDGAQIGYIKDADYHMLRIVGLKNQILTGEFPSGIMSNFFGGYGYGVSLFYPDFTLILPSILLLLGVPLLTSYKIFVGVITTLICFSTYISCKRIAHNVYVSSMTTLLLCTSIFYIADIWQRTGIAEYTAFIFMPFLFAGLNDIFHNDAKGPYFIALGLSGMLLTHTIMMVIGIIMTAIVYIINLKMIITNRSMFMNTLKAAFFALCATMFYWLPMLEQLSSQTLQYHIPWTNIGDNAEPISILFSTQGYFAMIAYVGLGINIFFGLFVVYCISITKKVKANSWIIAGLFLIIAMTSKIIPWEKLNDTFLNHIQFTYRLYPYALFCLCIGISATIYNLENKLLIKAITIAMAILSIAGGIYEQYTYCAPQEFVENDYYEKSENTYHVGAGEWLPVEINVDLCLNGNIIETDMGNLNAIYPYSIPTNRISADNSIGATQLIFPKIWYKGYSAVIHTNEKNIPLRTLKSPDGYVQVENPIGYRGVITLTYNATLLSICGRIVSIMCWLIFVIKMLKSFILNSKSKLRYGPAS